jgi:hypothetical protein
VGVYMEPRGAVDRKSLGTAGLDGGQSPLALPRGRSPRYQLNRRLVGHLEKKGIYCIFRESNPLSYSSYPRHCTEYAIPDPSKTQNFSYLFVCNQSTPQIVSYHRGSATAH